MKFFVRITLCFTLLTGLAFAAEWDNPQWLKTQSVNSLTEEHGFKLIRVTSSQNALHYHLEKGTRASGFTYVTCIGSYDASSARRLHCFKP